MEGFYKTFSDIFRTIEYSINEGRIVPALILIYSSIDSASVLFTIGKSNSDRDTFKKWVKDWMLKSYPLPCNEVDLYAARCGLLHQHISESDLSSKRKAKQIYYSWGNKDTNDLEKTIKSQQKENEIIAVKVEDLFRAFREGMADCYESNSKDENWMKQFQEKAKRLFIAQIDIFLDKT